MKGKSYRDAVEKAKAGGKSTVKVEAANGKATNGKATNGKASTSRSGLIMEVFIDTLPPGKSSSNSGRKSSASSGAEDPPESDVDSDAPRKTKRRVATRKVMVISDDEGGSTSEEEKPKKSKKAAPKKKASNASSESSDYEGSPAEESDSDAEETALSSGNESTTSSKKITSKAKTGKTKAKVIPRPKSTVKKATTSSSNDDTEADDMDVDDAPKKKVTKRKAADNDKRPTKKQKRTDSDPWKLESKPVKKDWTQMRAPPLEMFHFARKVVDEYTYLDGKIHSLVTRMTAERSWVLSGTPPIHDFGALKTIAAFLNLHLGVDDDAEGQSAEIKKRRREQTGEYRMLQVPFLMLTVATAVERFHSFREVHSLEWHAHRHEVGQTFLNRFVRQVFCSKHIPLIYPKRSSRTSLKSTKFRGQRRSRKLSFLLQNVPFIWNSNITCAPSI